MKPKARTKKRTKSDPWHPLPSLKDASGVWQGVSAGESAAASGGGPRRTLGLRWAPVLAWQSNPRV